MPDPTSVKELHLKPIAGKQYFNIDREWREEFIYFLMVDRFQDDIQALSRAVPRALRALPHPIPSSEAT